MRKSHFLFLSILGGLIVGFGLVKMTSQDQPASDPTNTSTISVKISDGTGINNAASSAALVIGSAAIGPKKGDSDKTGLQSVQSVDQLVGGAQIK